MEKIKKRQKQEIEQLMDYEMKMEVRILDLLTRGAFDSAFYFGLRKKSKN